jgi:hypothetical protein
LNVLLRQRFQRSLWHHVIAPAQHFSRETAEQEAQRAFFSCSIAEANNDHGLPRYTLPNILAK